MTNTAPLPAISPETLDELRWLANSSFAIPIVEKPVLTILLDTYERAAAEALGTTAEGE